MNPLPPPYEYLELRNLQSLIFVPERFEEGSYTFTTGVRTKTVPGYRVYLSQQQGPQRYRVGLTGDLRGQNIGSAHIDIGQSRLYAFLKGLMPGIVPHAMAITLVAHGVRPALYFEVSARQV